MKAEGGDERAVTAFDSALRTFGMAPPSPLASMSEVEAYLVRTVMAVHPRHGDPAVQAEQAEWLRQAIREARAGRSAAVVACLTNMTKR